MQIDVLIVQISAQISVQISVHWGFEPLQIFPWPVRYGSLGWSASDRVS